MSYIPRDNTALVPNTKINPSLFVPTQNLPSNFLPPTSHKNPHKVLLKSPLLPKVFPTLILPIKLMPPTPVMFPTSPSYQQPPSLSSSHSLYPPIQHLIQGDNHFRVYKDKIIISNFLSPSSQNEFRKIKLI